MIIDLRLLKGGEYFAAYAKIFAFHNKHINACTDVDWFDCADDLGQFKTPFERALMLAVINELDRDAKEMRARRAAFDEH